MRRYSITLNICLGLLLLSCSTNRRVRSTNHGKTNQLTKVQHVTVTDSFWSPQFERWRTTTANDVLDKFEAKNLPSASEQAKNNVFANFDQVAQGKKGTGHHAGLPWFDGLIYETIRGIVDLHPDPQLIARLDGYIDRIEAAQQADPKGYLNTYTDLMEPTHRWGDNGGMLRWQHDVYNAGMLIEAGVHYYQATGKTKLLTVATRYANHMSELMGPAPRRNIVPAHSGPEEAVLKLYWLFRQQPDLKTKLNIPVHEKAYYELAQFWIENRGVNVGYPLWLAWGSEKSEKWIKEQQYKTGNPTAQTRPSWGDYAQDSISVFKQTTIEGHAVRATLLATGLTAMALENHASAYVNTATNLWDNMVGRRMFVTGGVGAIHSDEKFGPDFFLPTDAYLETCAAVGAGFFSQRLNELTGEGKYMDEFERVLYNNVLTGVSLSGTQYTYQNPLNAHRHARWNWHACPCCPPMFLKLVSSLPDYIYASAADRLYVNLFVGSSATVELAANAVALTQKTNYPWDGNVTLELSPQKETTFAVHVRIPGWARGLENPYGLYQSSLISTATFRINGKPTTVPMMDGYAVIKRRWKKGDRVELVLPMQPRLITATEQVKDLKGMVAIASGPIVYCLESIDNRQIDSLALDTSTPLQLTQQTSMLNGVNVITGVARDAQSRPVTITAIPYYAVGNRAGEGYKVWLPESKRNDAPIR